MVLLIDEVDVFLGKEFYGQVYNPSFYLKGDEINELLRTIWKGKTLSLKQIKATSAFISCTNKYSNWKFVIEEAVKDMIVALKDFGSSTYDVYKDKIVYLYGESMVENITLGYDTVWSYFKENENGRISNESLKSNIGILVNCGTFSYAEMPHDFSYIAGVSGTLKTLAEPERKILSKVYHINKMTYLPSVFDNVTRDFDRDPEKHISYEEEEEQYEMKLRGQIDLMKNAKRAILVFFESIPKLEKFLNCTFFEDFRKSPDVQIINEKVSAEERELFIKRAAGEGKITLLTRTFGRGTDFECRQPTVLANGGIHVLQTFFSEEASEEYQIKGRSARQGDPGSFQILVHAPAIEWVLGSKWKEELAKPKLLLYKTLNHLRNKIYDTTCEGRFVGIDQVKKHHDASKKFMQAILNNDVGYIKSFVGDRNKGASINENSSRTILLMDATGSMSSLLNAVKDTVCKMFELVSLTLKEKGLAEDCFQLQCVVYRDYDCRENILQSSAWETKPINLRQFMEKVSASGGGDYEEAIEIGLLHAVKESKKQEGISQVLLIADAPAKEPHQIRQYRDLYGGEEYWLEKYGPATYYQNELAHLISEKIPVHTFYLENGCKPNLEKIATSTKGTCRYLNIRKPDGVKELTCFVTEEVLRTSGGSAAEGEQLVNLFKTKISKSFL
uniref:SecA family profile domain-containing protein n=1 Tax=Arcella intermedia TaxID=1963864 RepID=A0A6B2KZ85_9EUKA